MCRTEPYRVIKNGRGLHGVTACSRVPSGLVHRAIALVAALRPYLVAEESSPPPFVAVPVMVMVTTAVQVAAKNKHAVKVQAACRLRDSPCRARRYAIAGVLLAMSGLARVAGGQGAAWASRQC